jgi:aminoglycoside N3'-acetyltransferase
MSELISSIKKHIEEISIDNLFYHTDLLRGIRLKADENLLNNHCKIFLELCENTFMPVFNYEFPKTRIFNLQKDVSQIGVINEHFRKNFAQWQTTVPMFSVSGTGSLPKINENNEIDPFGEGSIFEYLHKNNSAIIYYGANFNSTTFVHYVESVSNLLSYRYFKTFKGTVVSEDISKEVALKLHLRPRGKTLNYDWNRLEQELTEEKILHSFKERITNIKVIKTDDLFNFWLNKIQQNPLHFLDDESKYWIKPHIEKLGRPFQQTDFE